MAEMAARLAAGKSLDEAIYAVAEEAAPANRRPSQTGNGSGDNV